MKHNNDKLKIEHYLSALMDRSRNLRNNIDIYNDKLKSINSKLSMATHTFGFKKQIKHFIRYNSKC